MPIPDYQSLMLPLLQFAADEAEHSLGEAIDALAQRFGLSEAEYQQLLPSGRQSVLANRTGWARTYLVKAGLLEATRRGFFRITARGLKVLEGRPPTVDARLLENFEEFRAFRALRRPREQEEAKLDAATTPEEALESAYKQLRDDLARDLLDRLKSVSPALFERIVVELLVKMGYGGSRLDAGQAIGRSGDEGIDGIIKEDRLGLDVIYLQAKRWAGPVGRPEVQKFAGALQGQRARKGVMITTSTFTQEAQEFAARIDTRIVLIDGERLAQLMIDQDLGVSPVASYVIKRIDSDYFTED